MASRIECPDIVQLNSFMKSVITAEGEGIILRQQYSPYTSGRNPYLVKLKVIIFAVITSACPSFSSPITFKFLCPFFPCPAFRICFFNINLFLGIPSGYGGISGVCPWEFGSPPVVCTYFFLPTHFLRLSFFDTDQMALYFNWTNYIITSKKEILSPSPMSNVATRPPKSFA